MQVRLVHSEFFLVQSERPKLYKIKIFSWLVNKLSLKKRKLKKKEFFDSRTFAERNPENSIFVA